MESALIGFVGTAPRERRARPVSGDTRRVTGIQPFPDTHEEGEIALEPGADPGVVSGPRA